jgi:hypothetical protein
MAATLNSGPADAVHQLCPLQKIGLTRSSIEIEILFSRLSAFTEVFVEIEHVGNSDGDILGSASRLKTGKAENTKLGRHPIDKLELSHMKYQ